MKHVTPMSDASPGRESSDKKVYKRIDFYCMLTNQDGLGERTGPGALKDHINDLMKSLTGFACYRVNMTNPYCSTEPTWLI